jgi:ABC-type sugar transport system permease subunit
MLGLAAFDALALYLMWGLVGNGKTVVAIVMLAVTALLNVIFLSDRLYPIRWLSPGLVLMLMMVVYPLLYTVYVAFTNYSDGHLLSKEQVIGLATRQYYQPPDAVNYDMTVYRSPGGDFLLLLKDPQGKYFTGTVNEGLKPYALSGEPPAQINGYDLVPTLATFQYLTQLEKVQIPAGSTLINVTSPNQAQQLVARYVYDPAADTLKDQQTGTLYRPVRGNFVDSSGKPLPEMPGFTAVVGGQNFARVVTDRNIKGPFFQVFLWTLIFAAATVGLNFSLGLLFALVLNDPRLPLKGLFRSIMIIPYAIPGFISILVWVGLLNPLYGPFNIMLKNLFGVSPEWFSNGTLTKIAILGINMWLGYPYMMLITLGALQSIPTDMYEAADLDGAGGWSKFRYLTLPLLLISVGPLLIGAFAFNFNNFTVIDLVNEGGPPLVGASTPAGQTDILISYTYRLAFSSGRGADFGMASTIAIIIFILIASITAVNFRFTRQLEEVMR